MRALCSSGLAIGRASGAPSTDARHGTSSGTASPRRHSPPSEAEDTDATWRAKPPPCAPRRLRTLTGSPGASPPATTRSGPPPKTIPQVGYWRQHQESLPSPAIRPEMVRAWPEMNDIGSRFVGSCSRFLSKCRNGYLDQRAAVRRHTCRPAFARVRLLLVASFPRLRNCSFVRRPRRRPQMTLHVSGMDEQHQRLRPCARSAGALIARPGNAARRPARRQMNDSQSCAVHQLQRQAEQLVPQWGSITKRSSRSKWLLSARSVLPRLRQLAPQRVAT